MKKSSQAHTQENIKGMGSHGINSKEKTETSTKNLSRAPTQENKFNKNSKFDLSPYMTQP